MSTSTDIIRNELTPLIARLEDPATPTEFIADTMNRLEFTMQLAKELLDAGKSALGERIRQTGRTVEYGDWIWVLSAPKETKCRDKPATLALLLELYTPGEVAREFLGSQPFKHGSIRKAIDHPETFDRLFVTDTKEGVEKKPRKLNKNFIEGTSAA